MLPPTSFIVARQEVGLVTKIVVKKTDSEVEKRDVQIADETGKVVQLTLWDSRVNLVSEDDATRGSIFAAKNVRVSDFGGRSLSTTPPPPCPLTPSSPHPLQTRNYTLPASRHNTRTALRTGPTVHVSPLCVPNRAMPIAMPLRRKHDAKRRPLDIVRAQACLGRRTPS